MSPWSRPESKTSGQSSRVRSTSSGREIRTVNQRLDRLFLTLGAGMVAMLVAVFTEFIIS